MKPYHRFLVATILLGLVYVTGLGMRRTVLEASYQQHARILPFTLESALYFRRIQQVMETGHLPEVDNQLEYPHPVDPRKIYTVGSEYVYAFMSSFFPRSMPLSERIRWLDGGWFCLGLPLMVLWIRWWMGSWSAGLCAGLFYACSISSVMRSTGLELSRENVALPWLLGHLAFSSLAIKQLVRWKCIASASASALCLALSLCSWDLIQYYLYLWGFAGVAWICGGAEGREGRRWCWGLCVSALVLAGLWNPYLRSHGFLFSPLLWMALGVVGAGWLPRRWGWKRIALPLVLAMVPFLAWQEYSSSYGHFADLLAAKIQFLNHKPADPTLLDFDASMMWVPALHSANLGLTLERFPAILLLSVISALLIVFKSRYRSDPYMLQLLAFTGISFLTFFFFVRFQVYCALFASALMGVALGVALKSRGWMQWPLMAGLALGLAVEAGQVLGSPERWGRTGVYYAELAELENWMAEHVAPEPVLANFGVSASLLTYAGCPVLLHPKFETEEIRDRFRQFAMLLFTGTEQEFRDWADEQGAGYYVHGMGEFAEAVPAIYQMRYFVDALNPPSSVPAKMFEEDPASLKQFRMVWENRKYRVFKIRTFADEAEASIRGIAASLAFQRGDLEEAERAARESLELLPDNEQALKILNHVLSLREQGFSHDAP